MENSNWAYLLRERITELRIRKDVSEHRMSLELGKSGAYIRSITSGASLPSMNELFNIIEYFDMSPAEFFEIFTNEKDLKDRELINKLKESGNDWYEKYTKFTELFR